LRRRGRAYRDASARSLATSVPFYLVDVFAERPLTGNPLAVVADAESQATPRSCQPAPRT
jgi:hypothetical protein